MRLKVASYDPTAISSPDEAELYYDGFELYQEAFSPLELDEYQTVTDKANLGLAGKIAGKTICMALVSWESSLDPANPAAAELTHLAVNSVLRNHSVGQTFLQAIESSVASTGKTQLDVVALNDRSFNFYRKNGYQPLSSTPGVYEARKRF